MADRNALLRVLHARKREVGVDDESYRARLKREFNVVSAKDLDDAQLARAAQMFRVKQKANFPHTRKAKALWIALGNLGSVDRTDAALDAFVERQTGKPRLAFLTPAESNAVTEALKDMLVREGYEFPKIDKDGRGARRALLEAQWKKLFGIGAVRIDHIWALDSFLDKKFGLCHGGCRNMTKEQLDSAAKELGRWIRTELAKRAAAA